MYLLNQLSSLLLKAAHSDSTVEFYCVSFHFFAPVFLFNFHVRVSNNFYSASTYASMVLAVVILSDLSVRLSHACFVTKPNDALQIF